MASKSIFIGDLLTQHSFIHLLLKSFRINLNFQNIHTIAAKGVIIEGVHEIITMNSF